MAEVEQKSIDQKVRELYPMLVAYLDHPEIGPILRQAGREGWTSSRLEGAVHGTNWWQSQDDVFRKVSHLKENNPGEFQRQLDRKLFDLYNLSVTELGFGISPNELRPIAEQALMHGLSNQQAVKAMQGLQRYRDKSDSEREFVALALLDPETLNQRISQMTFDLRATANDLGVQLDESDVLDMSAEALRDGWTGEQARQRLVERVDWTRPDKLRGAAGEAFTNVRRIASDYLVNLSDQAQQRWAAAVLGGEGDLSQFTEYAMQQAVSRFPSMQGALERGLTVQDYVEPYRQLIAQTWEINPDEVDFFNERTSMVLDGSVDEKGERRPMTMSEAAKWLRSQEEYQQTDDFRHKVADFSEFLGQKFGQVAA